MKHYASPAFWALYSSLPQEVRALADKNYELLKADPRHPSLYSNELVRFGLCVSVVTIERLATKSQTESSGSGSEVMRTTTSLSANKQLQRTVMHKVPRRIAQRPR